MNNNKILSDFWEVYSIKYAERSNRTRKEVLFLMIIQMKIMS